MGRCSGRWNPKWGKRWVWISEGGSVRRVNNGIKDTINTSAVGLLGVASYPAPYTGIAVVPLTHITVSDVCAVVLTAHRQA